MSYLCGCRRTTLGRLGKKKRLERWRDHHAWADMQGGGRAFDPKFHLGLVIPDRSEVNGAQGGGGLRQGPQEA